MTLILPEGHNMAAAFGDMRFRSYHCGYSPDMYFNVMAYVRLKPLSRQSFDKGVTVTDRGSRWILYDTPDREVLFTREGLTLGGDRPLNDHGEPWHHAVSLALNAHAGDDIPFDRYMLNPHALRPSTETKMRKKRTIVRSDKICIMDSGGFQLGYGGTNFIHPVELAKVFADNADEGVVLDIPARQIGDDPEIMKHTAKIHRLNARMMVKHLPEGFRFTNVVHGRTLELLDAYRAATEHDVDYDICCISGMLRFNIIEAIYRIMYIVSTGRSYNQYHLLGVSNPPLLAAAIKLAYMYKKSGKHILLTNDSSSPIGFALKRTYYSQPNHYDGLQPVRYGARMSSSQDTPAGNLDNPHRRFGVGDPLTNLIGNYMDFVHVDNNIMSRTYAIYQNQVEISRYVAQMCWYAEHLDDKEYRELVQMQYKGSIHGQLLLAALDFMTAAFETDLNTAFNKFKYYMPLFTGDLSIKKFPTLFEGEEEMEEVTFKANKKRLIKVIKGYYEFHRNGTIPEPLKKDANKTANLVVKI